MLNKLSQESRELFKNISEAQKYHDDFGGILLVLDNGYAVCTCCIDPCTCDRSMDWLDSLAPSWSEAHPANLRRTKVSKDKPVQHDLL